MPGTAYSPAGEYGWQGSLKGDFGGMHWFRGDGSGEVGDIVFRVGAACDAFPGISDAPPIPVSVGGFEAVYVEPYEPPVSYNGRHYKEGKKIGWKDGVQALDSIVRYALAD